MNLKHGNLAKLSGNSRESLLLKVVPQHLLLSYALGASQALLMKCGCLWWPHP